MMNVVEIIAEMREDVAPLPKAPCLLAGLFYIY